MGVCKIQRMHLSRSYYRGGLHLCSCIIQPSFSPDARAVIIDSLQPQQTYWEPGSAQSMLYHFYTLSDEGRRQPPVGSSSSPEQKRTESYKELVRTT